MKFGLICLLTFLVGALSLDSSPWSETGNWPVLTEGLSAFALPYPSPTPVGYTINSLPVVTSHGQEPYDSPCHHEITDQVIVDYRNAIHNLTIPLLKKAAAFSAGHYVMSTYTIWQTLAAIAEGSSGPTQEELLKSLQLPLDVCKRQLYYRLATTREQATSDIVLGRNRALILDSSLQINKLWEHYVKSQTHLDTKQVPFKSNPFVEIERLKKVYKAQLPGIDLSGNSIIMESLDYHGLWSEAFTDAVIEEGPFYNNFGEAIGTMEYMKVTKKANIGYVPSINMKVLDLPVGREGRYRMYFAISEAQEEFGLVLDRIKPNLLIEAALSLKQTAEPVDILIPKLSMTSEIDVRYLLEEIGIKSLWTDPNGTRNISEPAALPTAYVQRVTVTLDNGGVHSSNNLVPAVPSFAVLANKTELLDQPAVTSSFIANKPLFFGLVDTETLTSLFSATFSKLNTY